MTLDNALHQKTYDNFFFSHTYVINAGSEPTSDPCMEFLRPLELDAGLEPSHYVVCTRHSSEIRCLGLMKCSSEMLQILTYF